MLATFKQEWCKDILNHNTRSKLARWIKQCRFNGKGDNSRMHRPKVRRSDLWISTLSADDLVVVFFFFPRV